MSGRPLPFDAAFSRRPPTAGGSSNNSSSSSLMGEYGRGGGGGRMMGMGDSHGGGGGGYDDVDGGYHHGGGGGGFENLYERVPRIGGGGGMMRKDRELGGGDYGHGGWRQRSPSPPQSLPQPPAGILRGGNNYRGQTDRDIRDRERDGGDRRRVGGDYREMMEIESSSVYPSQRSSSSSSYSPGGMRRNPSSLPSLMDFKETQMMSQAPQHHQPQQQQQAPTVIMLPSQATGLMGNAFMQPMVLPAFQNAAFAQPVIQQQVGGGNPFGPGIGMGNASSSIYGIQTQQGFTQSRNLINADDSSRRGRDRDRDRGARRRSPSPSRKRNLVLRDPRPSDDLKRALRSSPIGGKKRPSSSVSDSQKVKRVSLGSGNNNNRNRSKSNATSAPTAAANKDKEKTKSEGNNGNEKSADDTKKKDKEKDKDRKTDYDGIPSSLLVCKVCQKSMNDGQSFDNHLTGKAHLAMLTMLQERFAKRAELLMNDSKCSEAEVGIELERQRRAGTSKGGRSGEKGGGNYCKMCDCNYVTNWGTHKVSLGHRLLKEFLHPTCRLCNAPFMHRKDWVVHLLSAGHLQKLKELKEEDNPKNSQILEEWEAPTLDELFTVQVELTRDEKPVNSITIRPLDGREPLTEEMREILKNDRGEIELPEGEIPIPKEYNSELMVGGDAVVPVSGNRCRVCRIYIPSEKSVDEHCQSKEHYSQYVGFLKKVNRYREHKEREKKEAEEKAKKEEERKKRREEEEKKKKEKLTNGDQKKPETASDENKVANGEEDKMETETAETKGQDGEGDEEGLNTDIKEEPGDDTQQDQIDMDENAPNADDEGIENEEEEMEQEEEIKDEYADENEIEADSKEEEDPSTENGEGTANPDQHVEEEEDDEVPVPTIVSVTSAADAHVEEIKNQEEKAEEDLEEDKTEEIQEILEEEPEPVVNTPAPSRGRGRGRGRAISTPNLRNVQPKIDTGIRGGVRGGRGATSRSRSPRGGRGARGAR